ncbi:MAG: helix-turn-helix transcriptional regulator [Phycisphaerae bacterium]
MCSQIELKGLPMLELGKAIRIVRAAKGMRLSTLADNAGVSIPFLSLVENGERQPSLDVLRRLANALRIPPEVLIILAQPANGRLQSEDQVSQALVAMIQKMLSVEDELRSTLSSETETDETRSDEGR